MQDAVDARVPYAESVATARILVGSSEYSTEQKKESAISTRINSMLTWADLMHVATMSIDPEKSEIDFSTLQSRTNELKPYLSESHTADIFLEKLTAMSATAQATRVAFWKEAGLAEQDIHSSNSDEVQFRQNRLRVGQTIYREIAEREPTQGVYYLDTPLAVAIRIDSQGDYNIVNTNTNSGGFFRSDAKVHESFRGRQSAFDNQFPLICLLNKGQKSRKHETNHALIHAIRQTLDESAGAHIYWQREERADYSWEKWKDWFQKNRSDLFLQLTQDRETPNSYSVWEAWRTASNQPIWNWNKNYLEDVIVPNALGDAKDEIITDYLASGNFSHLNNLTKEDGLYDYIAKWFDTINWKGKVWRNDFYLGLDYEYGRGGYVDNLEHWVWGAKDVLNQYNKYGLTDRMEVFAELLMQTPLRLPRDSVRKSSRAPFDETLGYEMDVVGALDGNIGVRRNDGYQLLYYFRELKSGKKAAELNDYWMMRILPFRRDKKYEQKLEKYLKDLDTLHDAYIEALQKHQHQAFFPIVNDFKTRFAKLSLPVNSYYAFPDEKKKHRSRKPHS